MKIFEKALSKNNSLKESALAVLSSDIVHRASNFILGIMLARIVSVEAYGFYGFASSLAVIFIFSPQSSFDQWVQTEASRSMDAARNMFFPVFVWKVLVLTATLLFCGMVVFLSDYSPTRVLTSFAVFMLHGSIAFFISVQSFFRSMQKYLYDSFIRIVVYASVLSISIFTLIISKSLIVFLLTGIIVYSVFTLFGFLKVISILNVKLSITNNAFLIKDWIKTTGPYVIATASAMAYWYSDSITVNVFLGENYTALYKAAFTVSILLMVVPSSIFSLLLPALAPMFHKNRENYTEKANQFSFLTIAITFLLAVVVVMFPKTILGLLYNGKYDHSYMMLKLLAVAAIPAAVISTDGVVLLHRKNFKAMIGLPALFLLLNAILNFFLNTRYEFIGFGYARIITNLLFMLAYVYVIRGVSRQLFKYSKLLFVLFAMSVVHAIGLYASF